MFGLYKKSNTNAINFVIFIFSEIGWNLVCQIEHILILWSKRLYVFPNNFWADNIEYRTGNPFGKSRKLTIVRNLVNKNVKQYLGKPFNDITPISLF